MLYRVKLFASFREAVGHEIWEIESEQTLSGRQLLTRFFQTFPRLEKLKSVTRLAVNTRFCQDDPQLHPDDEIALIPPVSGG